MKQRKKKAFTLTELLVVLVIIGVLAAVVLPKFNKVIETRKTTEAEGVMAAVRMEQERRCALEKLYVGHVDKLVKAEVLPQTDSKNYTYILENAGMLASSKGSLSYELKMPSYADGRVCCEGADCNKLNKNYPTCTDLVNQSDYRVTPECMSEQTSACENGAEKTGPCNGCGTRVTERCVNGQWTTVNETCSKKEEDCSAKACDWRTCYSSNYSSGSWPWKYHPRAWYADKTWQTDPTECCDPKDKCPVGCEDGKVQINEYKNTDDTLCCATPCSDTPDDPRKHRTSVQYEELGACWAGYCREVCGGSGYACPKINNPLTQASKDNGMNREYWYEAAWKADPWMWVYSETECYRCPVKSLQQSAFLFPDYKDEQGNVVNKGLDLEDCSVAKGCPAGYAPHPTKEQVCLKRHKFVPQEHRTKGVIIFGQKFVSTVNASIRWFETGNVTKSGKCLRLQNATGVSTSIGPGGGSTRCSSYGGPEAYCKAVCDNVVACTAGVCYADDTEYDGESLRNTLAAADRETTWTNRYTGESTPAGPKADVVPDSCCQSNPPDDLSLAVLTAPGCKQPHNVRVVSTHYFSCVAAD